MHEDVLNITIERHDRAATIYVAGVSTVASAIRLVRVCESLPSDIRVARLDLGGVRDAEEEALTVLEGGLRSWRSKRGVVRMTAPPRALRSPRPPHALEP